MVDISTYRTTTGYYRMSNCLAFQYTDVSVPDEDCYRNMSCSLHGLGVYVFILLITIITLSFALFYFILF